MHFFQYKNNLLYCEDVNLNDLSQEFNTPLYVYSKKTLLRHLNLLQEAFSEVDPLICFSMKANSNLAISKLLIEAGSGLDIVSGGELHKALKVGADPAKIVYAGVGKTEEEIEFAISCGVLLFNVESLPEIELINKVAGKLSKVQKVSIRVNPDVKPDTHGYIITGQKITKFGIDLETCLDIINSWDKYANLELAGLHVHIGSQITEPKPFVDSITKVGSFIKAIREKGKNIEYLNIGGGLGIVYNQEKPQTASEFADAILDLLKSLDVKIIMEPGRFIAGNSGVLLTKVLYLKKTPVKNFIIVDAGMNDLLRPSLYSAYHDILSVNEASTSSKIKVDIVGPICESGDFLAKDRMMPELKSGNVLAVMGAGAYGFSMSSNYNSRPRAAEVLIDSDRKILIRQRETYEDLISKENI